VRTFGLACIASCVAGVAAFGAGDEVEAIPVGRLAGVGAAAPAGAMPLVATAVDSPLVATPRAPVAAPPAPTFPSERRFRRRDRYWLDMPYHPGNWTPPEGPVRIALQAGHWRADEAPEELRGIRENGTRANGMAEWEVNLEIARRAAAMLEEIGYEVDVLPAVVPPGYRAHLFISIHADGSADPRATGYRVAAPRRDVTGRAEQVARLLERSYGEATGLYRVPTVTRRMSNYYAFNYGRYQHALHPLTIGVILETGFLTSASDRRIIVDEPARAARGIVAAVTAFAETPPPQVAVAAEGGAVAGAEASGGGGG
jgi:N-acetylmuramoyl-L-alanine amidase